VRFFKHHCINVHSCCEYMYVFTFSSAVQALDLLKARWTNSVAGKSSNSLFEWAKQTNRCICQPGRKSLPSTKSWHHLPWSCLGR
jgi:hypothetical protein